MTAGTLSPAQQPLQPALSRVRTTLSLSRDPLRKALFVLVVMTISRIHQNYPILAMLRPALLATVVIGVYAYMNPHLLASGSILRTVPGKIMAGFFVIACLSVPLGISLGNSGKFMLEVYLKILVFGVLVIVATRSVGDFYTVIWSFVLSCGILSLMSLFLFQLTTYDGYARLSDMYTYDANDVGCVLCAGLGFALLTLQTSGRAGRWLSGLIILGSTAAIARTGSRGALVGLVAVGVALLFSPTPISVAKRILVGLVAVLGLSLAAPPGYWKQMSTILNPKADYNYTATDGRKAVAERGVQYMLSYPVAGLGINNFTKAECTISDVARNHTINTGLRCTPPHNSYVQTGAELGVPGLILWLSFMLSGTVGVLLLRRRLPRKWANGDAEERFLYHATAYVPVGMAGFAVTAFFLSFAWMDVTYLLMGFLASLHALIRDKREGNVPAAPGSAPNGRSKATPRGAGRRQPQGQFVPRRPVPPR